MVLSDVDILQCIDKKEIILHNFDKHNLQPASYDLCAGEFVINEEGLLNLKERNYIKIPRGSTIVIYPTEKIELGLSIVARFGLRSKFARRGLMLLSGIQIDPGFQGVLSCTLYNSGSSEVIISYNEAFASVEFVQLKTVASKGYNGQYQNQTIISKEDIEVVTKDYKNIAKIEKTLTDMEIRLRSVSTINNTVILGLVVSTAIFILDKLFSSSSTSNTNNIIAFANLSIVDLLIIIALVPVVFFFGGVFLRLGQRIFDHIVRKRSHK